MSWVAEANAVIQKRMRVKENSEGALPAAICSGESPGRENATRKNTALIRICITTVHQRLVLTRSTKGLQKGLITQGRYRSEVYHAMLPLSIPIFLNMMTDMVLTIKYGRPSAKYSVGTHIHGFTLSFFICRGLSRDNRMTIFPCRNGPWKPSRQRRSGRGRLRGPNRSLQGLSRRG